MKNKTLRTFVIDGKEMQFNLTFFNNIFKTKAKQEKKGIGELEEELAAEIFVEKATVHAWRNRVNGPSDLEKIQQIAEYFKLNVKDFLIEVNEMITLERENNSNDIITIPFGFRERESFKRVYKEMLNFMNMRIKHDKALSDASQEYIMRQIGYECISDEEKDKEEYFMYEIETLDMYLRGAETDWDNVDFVEELEKVGRVLEEEIVDLPNEIYMLLEIYISQLEQTNDKRVSFGRGEEIPFEDEGYWSDYVEDIYTKNEFIISSIKENIRTLLFKLKS